MRRIHIPADRFRGVPRVLVFREQDQQRPAEGLEERCEDERQRGLGDASIGGERVDELAKPLASSELDDEWAERRRVHTGGGTSSREAIVTSTERLTGAGRWTSRATRWAGRRATSARPHHGHRTQPRTRKTPTHPQGYSRTPTETLASNLAQMVVDLRQKRHCRRTVQLNCCCASTSPSLRSTSTAPAARSTRASRSSPDSNGAST